MEGKLVAIICERCFRVFTSDEDFQNHKNENSQCRITEILQIQRGDPEDVITSGIHKPAYEIDVIGDICPSSPVVAGAGVDSTSTSSEKGKSGAGEDVGDEKTGDSVAPDIVKLLRSASPIVADSDSTSGSEGKEVGETGNEIATTGDTVVPRSDDEAAGDEV